MIKILNFMRTIIYFSSSARTTGNWTDLMQAGRMDIVCHVIVNLFNTSVSIPYPSKVVGILRKLLKSPLKASDLY